MESLEARSLVVASGQKDLQDRLLVGDLRMVAAAPVCLGTWRDAFHQMGNAVVVVAAAATAAAFLPPARLLHSPVAVQLETELLEVEDRIAAMVVAMTAAAAAAVAAEAEEEIAVALLAVACREVLIVFVSAFNTVSCVEQQCQVNCTGKVLALRRVIWRLEGHLYNLSLNCFQSCSYSLSNVCSFFRVSNPPQDYAPWKVRLGLYIVVALDDQRYWNLNSSKDKFNNV